MVKYLQLLVACAGHLQTSAISSIPRSDLSQNVSVGEEPKSEVKERRKVFSLEIKLEVCKRLKTGAS